MCAVDVYVDIEYNVTGWFDRSGASESVVGMVTSWQDRCSLPLCLALLRFFSVSILTAHPQGQNCGYSSVTHTHSISNSVSKHQRVFCSGKTPLSRVIIHSDEEGLEDNSLLYKHPLICQGKSILSSFHLSYFSDFLCVFELNVSYDCELCVGEMNPEWDLQVSCNWFVFITQNGYGFDALVSVLFVCICVCVCFCVWR